MSFLDEIKEVEKTAQHAETREQRLERELCEGEAAYTQLLHERLVPAVSELIKKKIKQMIAENAADPDKFAGNCEKFDYITRNIFGKKTIHVTIFTEVDLAHEWVDGVYGTTWTQAPTITFGSKNAEQLFYNELSKVLRADGIILGCVKSRWYCEFSWS